MTILVVAMIGRQIDHAQTTGLESHPRLPGQQVGAGHTAAVDDLHAGQADHFQQVIGAADEGGLVRQADAQHIRIGRNGHPQQRAAQIRVEMAGHQHAVAQS